MITYRAVFVDTWGWVALGYRHDPYHEAVKCLFRELHTSKISLHTSDYVLDEVVTLLFKRENFQEATKFVEGIIKAAASGEVYIERITSERFLTTWKLRQRLQDKPQISFTDLSSMVIMQEKTIHHVVTGDEHFIQVGMGFVRVP